MARTEPGTQYSSNVGCINECTQFTVRERKELVGRVMDSMWLRGAAPEACLEAGPCGNEQPFTHIEGGEDV